MVGLAALVCLIWPGVASAQRWSVDAGVSSGLTFTSNAELTPDGHRDAIFDIRPHIAIRNEGSRLKLSGSALLSGITYANHSLPGRLSPEVDLGAQFEAVERFFFIDAGVRAFQNSVDPFGPRSEAGSTSENSITTTQWRIVPRIEGSVGDLTHYSVRSENSWMRDYGGTSADPTPSTAGYFGRHSLSVTRDPRPLGATVDAYRAETRFRDQTQQWLVLEQARLSVGYLIDTDLTAGINVGKERSNDPSTGGQTTTYGAQADWRPSPRTSFSLFEEKRSFGHAWRLNFDHRRASFGWNVLLSRTLDTTAQSILDLPATNDVEGMLDSMFASRYPNATDRANAVRDFIARQGLPTSLLHPLTIRAQGFKIVTLRRVGISLIGVRNTLSLGAYQSTSEDTAEAGPLSSSSTASGISQRGVSFALSHRLTPVMGLTASADWSRVSSLGAAVPQRSIQRTARLRLNIETSPKSNLFAGARFRDLAADLSSEGRETAVFFGLDHRF
jgi:uncharacterized protein (PEP-CTERM system associated)